MRDASHDVNFLIHRFDLPENPRRLIKGTNVVLITGNNRNGHILDVLDWYVGSQPMLFVASEPVAVLLKALLHAVLQNVK